MLQAQDLTRFSVFSDMPQSKLKAISDKATMEELGPNEFIFRQNEPADSLYGLLEGQADVQFVFRDKILETNITYEESVISKLRNVDRPLVLETLRNGDLFGWSSMVGNERYTASVMTTEPSRVFRIEVGMLRFVLDADPEMGYVFMNHLSEIIARRLHWRTEKLVESWVEAFGADRVT